MTTAWRPTASSRRPHVKTPADVTDAIRDDRLVDDQRFAALDVAAFLAADYTETQVLELVLAVAVKTISNWSNHLFATSVDDVFTSRTWSAPATV